MPLLLMADCVKFIRQKSDILRQICYILSKPVMIASNSVLVIDTFVVACCGQSMGSDMLL